MYTKSIKSLYKYILKGLRILTCAHYAFVKGQPYPNMQQLQLVVDHLKLHPLQSYLQKVNFTILRRSIIHHNLFIADFNEGSQTDYVIPIGIIDATGYVYKGVCATYAFTSHISFHVVIKVAFILDLYTTVYQDLISLKQIYELFGDKLHDFTCSNAYKFEPYLKKLDIRCLTKRFYSGYVRHILRNLENKEIFPLGIFS